MKKRLLAAIMSLCMIVSLLPVSALATEPDIPATDNTVTSPADEPVRISKSVSEDGSELKLEVYVTNDVKKEVKAKPMDIVLVLDTSGSMDNRIDSYTYQEVAQENWSYNDIKYSHRDYYYKDGNEFFRVTAKYDWNWDGTSYWLEADEKQIGRVGSRQNETLYTGTLYVRKDGGNETRLEALQSAVNQFIGDVAADARQNSVDHRIAIVEFDDEVDTEAGLTSVSSGENQLKWVVNNKLDADGDTYPDRGLAVANTILQNGSSADRGKAVILFTDGSPAPAGTDAFDAEIAAKAVGEAYTLKNTHNATVFTVGVFGTNIIKDDEEDIKNYMNAVSSNYPQATAEATGWGNNNFEVELGKRADGNYYLRAENAADLEDVFQEIQENISSLKIVADATSVLSDTLSEYFTYGSDVTVDGGIVTDGITVEKVSVIGFDSETGTYTWGSTGTDITEDVTISLSDKTLSVSGFDYTNAQNAVTTTRNETGEITSVTGAKLVITIPIQPDTANASQKDWQDGTNAYPTNSVETGEQAGLTYKDKETNASLSTTLDRSPTTSLTAYTVTYEGLGTSVSDVVYLPNSEVTVIADPSKEGYDFAGWDISPDSVKITEGSNTFTMPEADVTLTAQWTAKNYNVTYEWSGLPTEAGIDTPTDTTANYSQTVTLDSSSYTTVKVGHDIYTFKGWTVSTADGETVNITDNQFTMPASDVTVTGNWQHTGTDQQYWVKYQVTGNLKPDVELPDDHQYYEGETVSVAAPLTAESEDGTWTFSGWTTSSGVTIEDGKFTMPDHDVTFIGSWTFIPNPPETALVTYKFESSDSTHALPDSVTSLLPQNTQEPIGKEITPASCDPVSVEEGVWTFDGWMPVTDVVGTDGLHFTGTWTFTANEPTPPELTKEEVLNLVQGVRIRCTNENAEQHVYTYQLQDGYEIDGPHKGSDGEYYAIVTVTADTYLDRFNKHFGDHTPQELNKKDVYLVYQNGQWAVKSGTDDTKAVEFMVACDAQPAEHTITVQVTNGTASYDEQTGEKITFTVEDGGEATIDLDVNTDCVLDYATLNGMDITIPIHNFSSQYTFSNVHYDMTLVVVYAEDKQGEIDEDGKETGDGTPDYRQVFIQYESTDPELGTVAPALQTVTLELDADHKVVTSGSIGLTGVATAEEGARFVNWTQNGTAFTSDADLSGWDLMTPYVPGATYIFYANFDVETQIPDTFKVAVEVYNGTATFNGAQVKDYILAGNGENITIAFTPNRGFEYERATLNGQAIEIPDNGIYTIKSVDQDCKIEVWFTESEEPEIPSLPDLPTILMDQITVDCVNGEADHPDKSYGIWNGSYTDSGMEDGVQLGLTGDDKSGWTYTIALNSGAYASKYDEDQGHPTGTHAMYDSNNVLVVLTWDETAAAWSVASAPIVVRVSCESEGSTEPGDIDSSIIENLLKYDVVCITDSLHNVNGGSLISGTYSYEVDKDSNTCEVKISDISAYIPDNHVLDKASAQYDSITLLWENGAWTVDGTNNTFKFYVSCDTEPVDPTEPGDIDSGIIENLLKYDVVCITDSLHNVNGGSLISGTYSYEVDKDSNTCEVKISDISAYIPDNHVLDKASAQYDSITLLWENGAWTVDGTNNTFKFYVSCDTEPVDPTEPGDIDSGIIENLLKYDVVCITDSLHNVNGGSLISGTYSYEVDKDSNTCEVKISDISAYIPDNHVLDKASAQYDSITLLWENGAWTVDGTNNTFKFYITCDTEPVDPTEPGDIDSGIIENLLKYDVVCITDSLHNVNGGSLISGTYSYEVDKDSNTCEVKISDISAYIPDNHVLDKASAQYDSITLLWENGAWTVDGTNNTFKFYVSCDTEPVDPTEPGDIDSSIIENLLKYDVVCITDSLHNVNGGSLISGTYSYEVDKDSNTCEVKISDISAYIPDNHVLDKASAQYDSITLLWENGAWTVDGTNNTFKFYVSCDTEPVDPTEPGDIDSSIIENLLKYDVVCITDSLHNVNGGSLISGTYSYEVDKGSNTCEVKISDISAYIPDNHVLDKASAQYDSITLLWENGAWTVDGTNNTFKFYVSCDTEPDTYTVTYNPNGGAITSGSSEIPVEAGQSVPLDATASWDDQHIFLGWSSDRSVKDQVYGAGDPVPKAEETITPTGDVTVYAIWAEDVNGDKVPDAEQVFIEPAPITIYTGGNGYDSAIDGSGDSELGQTTSGLPTPGFYITLPYELDQQLKRDHADDILGTALDLSDYLSFHYDDGTNQRTWNLERYDTNGDSQAYERFIYRILPYEQEDGTLIPIRLVFTDENGNETLSDDFNVSMDNLSQTYSMTIYAGALNRDIITADLVGLDHNASVGVATSTLTVRGVTASGDPTTEILDEVPTQQLDEIQAHAGDNVDYYINDSDLQVSDPSAVKLLVDDLVTDSASQAALESHGDAALNAAGINTSNLSYSFQYLDLVDFSNGNAYVTLGDNQSVDIYWPMPDDAARNTNFYVVHFDGLDREFTDLDSALSQANVEVYRPTEVNGNLMFSTSTFSPFALVYEKDTTGPVDPDEPGGGESGGGSDSDPTGNLTISKRVSGAAGDREDTFTFTVYLTDEDGDELEANFYYNGSGYSGNIGDGDSITLSGGESITIRNLPVGTRYEVVEEEANEDGYVTTSSGEEGTIRSSQTYTAAFTNTRNAVLATPEETGVDRWLNTDDHIAYLTGYPGDVFGPDNSMTRAEVAQMFYALLRDKNVTITKTFPDVPADAWYATAVNTLASLGMVTGDSNGNFRPNDPITRAEFCVVALAFAYEPASYSCNFSDVARTDWFYPYVAQATVYGWIGGYTDGSFGPRDSITRAQVTTIVNNMLGRAADQDYVIDHQDELVQFVDLNRTHWAYYQIMEAVNAHDYTKTGGSENWR